MTTNGSSSTLPSPHPVEAPKEERYASLCIRSATPDDLDQLDELEYDAVEDEPFTRRQWRHMLTRAHAIILVLEDRQHDFHEDQSLLGYTVLLLRKKSRAARLYSLAVHPCIRGHGQAARLLAALECTLFENAASPPSSADVHVPVVDVPFLTYPAPERSVCEVLMRQQSVDRIVLEVRADNRAALALYRANGYHALKWIDQFYHDGCAAYRMCKVLA